MLQPRFSVVSRSQTLQCSITLKNQQQSSQSDLHRRLHVILSTDQLALFQSHSDLYMYTLLPCRWAQWVGQSTRRQAKPGLSSKAFLYQTLVLATIRYGEEQRTETPFLRKTVLLPCFVAVFFRATRDTLLLQPLAFQYFLRSSDSDVNRQVDNIHKEIIASWTMAYCGLPREAIVSYILLVIIISMHTQPAAGVHIRTFFCVN